MNKYTFTLRHDKGKIRITTHATNLEVAMHLVMQAERCPEHAFLDACDAQGYELALRSKPPSKLVVLLLTASNVARHRSNPAAAGRDKPTDFIARTIDQRWRRVYVDPAGTYFVKHGAVKTVVTLP